MVIMTSFAATTVCFRILMLSVFWVAAPLEGTFVQSAHAQARSGPGFDGPDDDFEHDVDFDRKKPPRTGKPPRKKPRTKRKRGPATARARTPVRNNAARFRAREILLVLAPDATPDAIGILARRFGLVRLGDTTIALINARVVRYRTPRGMTPPHVLQLTDDPLVASAHPNYLYDLSQGKAPQYAIKKLDIKRAHATVIGSGVLVAVIDSGVNERHPALRGAVAGRFDAAGKVKGYNGDHGTGIASIIAARDGMTGTAPGARLLSAAAFRPAGARQPQRGSTYNVLRAIDWAVAQRAQILNMSFAGPRDPLLHNVLKAAIRKGAVAVAAAGNRGAKAPPAYPAAYAQVIAVTATDARDRLYRHANRGAYVAIAAPGVDILVARRSRSYGLISGTSAATAYVSGALALLLQARPDMKPRALADLIASTARDLGTQGRDSRFGHGLLDIHRALAVRPGRN